MNFDWTPCNCLSLTSFMLHLVIVNCNRKISIYPCTQTHCSNRGLYRPRLRWTYCVYTRTWEWAGFVPIFYYFSFKINNKNDCELFIAFQCLNTTYSDSTSCHFFSCALKLSSGPMILAIRFVTFVITKRRVQPWLWPWWDHEPQSYLPLLVLHTPTELSTLTVFQFPARRGQHIPAPEPRVPGAAGAATRPRQQHLAPRVWRGWTEWPPEQRSVHPASVQGVLTRTVPCVSHTGA